MKTIINSKEARLIKSKCTLLYDIITRQPFYTFTWLEVGDRLFTYYDSLYYTGTISYNGIIDENGFTSISSFSNDACIILFDMGKSQLIS